jgi:hypothetical protein
METRDEITAWIRAVLTATGWNANKWAKAAGVLASTITRLLKDPDASLPNSRTLAKLRQAAAEKVPGSLQVAPTSGGLDAMVLRRVTVAVLRGLGARQGRLAPEAVWSVMETVHALLARQTAPPTDSELAEMVDAMVLHETLKISPPDEK